MQGDVKGKEDRTNGERERERREGSPLLATDEVEIREAAKLSRVIQRMEVQFLQTTQHNTN